MTIKELKTLLDKAKGKIIVVEDEKPIMVIMPYEEQSTEILEGGPARRSPEQSRMGEGGPARRSPEQSRMGEGGLTLDDLPL